MDNKEMWSRHISGIKADISVVCEKKIEKKKKQYMPALTKVVPNVFIDFKVDVKHRTGEELSQYLFYFI